MKPLALCGALLLASCAKEDSAPAERARVRRLGGTTLELIPSSGQLPYCLAFTHSKTGVTRQLTMSTQNVSFDCTPGKPVGGRPFKVPLQEGPVNVYMLFSSEPLNAASVAEQLLDRNLSQLNAMDLRVPGRVVLEALEFVPEEDTAPAEGLLLKGRDAGAP